MFFSGILSYKDFCQVVWGWKTKRKRMGRCGWRYILRRIWDFDCIILSRGEKPEEQINWLVLYYNIYKTKYRSSTVAVLCTHSIIFLLEQKTGGIPSPTISPLVTAIFTQTCYCRINPFSPHTKCNWDWGSEAYSMGQERATTQHKLKRYGF